MCPACVLEFGLTGFDESFARSEPPTVAPPTSAGAATGRPHGFGDYDLLEELAGGGMGVVYRARQRSLGRIVAVKMIRAGHLAAADDIRRFQMEAAAAAQLQHPNIVTIHEVGACDGQHYFSMEYVEGRSLAELVREHPLPPLDAARHVQAVAEAIDFAHARGVLHRDLKPSNIMVGPDGQPRVTDFGLAKLLVEDATLTQTGAVLGSPGYMPPEQALGRAAEISVRSDVYALGGILYELITGRPPFRAATPLETLKLATDQEPVPPRRLNPRLPRDLETICLKCLEKDPARRYATARDLADELGRFRRDEAIRARPISPIEKLTRWCRRQPIVATSLAVSLVLLLALTVVSLTTAARVQREADRTTAARHQAEEKLYASYLAQARAGRLSGLAGRRSQSLAAVTAAARMQPSLDLRNEAIACLALSDLGDVHLWPGSTNESRESFVAWDHDMNLCATEPRDGTVAVRQAQSQTTVAEITVSRARIRFATFSPNARLLSANAADGLAGVWSVATRAPANASPLPRVLNQPEILAFHPHGHWLALAGQDAQIHIVPVADPAPGSTSPTAATPGSTRTVPVPNPPAGLAFAPGGNMLAAVVGREILRWSWPELAPQKSFQHGTVITCLTWHPDSRRLVAGDVMGGLIGWDTELDAYLTLPAHGQTVSHVAFHPQGDVLASHGWDGLSRFWDTASARQLFSTDTGLATAFDRSGTRLAFHREPGGFGWWDYVRSDVFRVLATPLGPTGADISPNGRWLVHADAFGWHLLDAGTAQESTFVALPGARSPNFHPDGNSLVVLTAETVLRWPLRPDNDGHRLIIGAATSLLTAPGADFQRGRFCADGSRLALAGRNRSFVVRTDGNTNDAKPVEFARGYSQSHAMLSPDYQWIVGTAHNGIGASLWQGNGKLHHILLTNENTIAAFSPDGRTLVTTSSRDYLLWNTQTWQVRRRVPLDLGSAVAGPIAFSPDGRLLAVAANRRDIRLLNPESGDEFSTLTAPDPVNLAHLSFSGDGSRLVAAAVGRSIQLWDLRTLRRDLARLGLDW